MKTSHNETEELQAGTMLPIEIHGWKATGKDKVYNQETIFDYIDGAGEVYRSYNFRSLLVRKYSKEEKTEIIADFFDMGTSKDAFGVFTHDLEGEDAEIGQGSTYKGGLLSFWKDRFFVSLYSEEETDEAKEALYALGRKIASSIKGEGKKPGLIFLFPLENLETKSLRYFHNHMILNYHYFVADENILLLDQTSEAVLGIYREENENVRLLIIRYANIRKATEAFRNFTEIYMPDVSVRGVVQTKDMKWTAAMVKNGFVIIVFDALSDSFAKKIIENVDERMKDIGGEGNRTED